MSAATNKALVREIFEGVARGDTRGFVDALADDVTMTITGDISWSRTFRGKEEVLRDLYGLVRARLDGPNLTTAERILADDDWVVVEARGHMRTTDGIAYENEYCLMYRLAEGRIVEMREYQDTAMVERVFGPYPAAEAS
ncbi:MAG: nuclear transport factor 2 family protein [Actinomycetota bacterium]|nr:nuclear transport factor 2 family protein [Actinomycetota bacterium]